MLYNNPPAYKTDFLPEQIAELAAEHPNLHAVKESSGDARRVTAIRALVARSADDPRRHGRRDRGRRRGRCGRLDRRAGQCVSGRVRGAVRRGRARRQGRARAKLYNWFLPLLRLDTVPKFVQYIKWVQAEVGRGTYVVRGPRLPLDSRELELVKGILAQALKDSSPQSGASAA